MANATAARLVEILRKHQLLDEPQLAELEPLAADNPDPRTAAREILRRGWLTAYQVNQVCQGKASELNLGPYVLLERLGEGGMGAVFKARHRVMNRVVALKVIRKERVASSEAVKRFHREIQAAAQMVHPNIVTAYDAAHAGDSHFLVMEYVEGTDLAQLVHKQGPLPVGLACEYIRQAALGLQHAHHKGMVHRDLKPGNLLVSSETGMVKLLDMGMARLQQAAEATQAASNLTQDGAVMGTPAYMAPEQALDSHTADIRADIYSLGCTLYFLLTGQAPFTGNTVAETLLKHQMHEVPAIEQRRPEVPPGLRAVLKKLLAKKPEERYATPAEVAEALSPWAAAPRDATIAAPPARKTAAVSSPDAATVGLSEPGRAAPGGDARPFDEAGNRGPVGRGSSRYRRVVAAAMVLLLIGGGLLFAQIIIRIKNRDGSVTEIKAPPGAEVEIDQDGKAVTKVGGKEAIPPGKTGQPLSVSALVAHPAALPGVKGWTIETRGPRGPICVMAYSPDGRWLAVVDRAGMVRLWDTVNGQLQKVLAGNAASQDNHFSVTWSPDSKRLTGRFQEVLRTWEVDSGRLLYGIDIPYGDVIWSPDGKVLAVASNPVSYYNPNDGSRLSLPPVQHPGGVAPCLTWSPDIKQIASGGPDKTVRIWEVTTGKVRQILDHPAVPEALAWSPDGKTLASSVRGADGVRLWDPESGKLLKTIGVTIYVPHAHRGNLLWSPDGTRLAAFVPVADQGGHGIAILDAGTGKSTQIRTPLLGPRTFAWERDGKRLAIGGNTVGSDGALAFYSVGAAKIERQLTGQPGNSFLAISPGAKAIGVGFGGSLRVFDGSATGQARKLPSSYASVAAFSPDGRTLAVRGNNEAIELWTLGAARPFATLEGHQGSMAGLAWSPDGKRIASRSHDLKVRVWDVATRKLQQALEGHTRVPLCAAWSPDSKLLASGDADGGVRVWDTDTGQTRHSIKEPLNIGMVAWSPDGNWLAVGVANRSTPSLWDVKRNERLPDLAKVPEIRSCATLCWAADGKTLAALDAGRVAYYDVAQPKQPPRIVRAPSALVYAQFTPDSRLLAASDRTSVWLWEAATGHVRATVQRLDNDGWLVINGEGHYRASPGVEKELIYVVQTEQGQQLLAPAEFAQKHGWKNDPGRVRLTEQ